MMNPQKLSTPFYYLGPKKTKGSRMCHKIPKDFFEMKKLFFKFKTLEKMKFF
jgi:hypothetical protein